ncbi:MAG: rod shape-determining protein MreC [Bdellovibrio sp.]|nr:rod shape-determining protein MreC [Bdellovibrio sp.]
MFKYIKEYRFYIILFFFILIPILAIDTSTRSPREYRIYDKIVLTFTAPIQNLMSWSLDLVVSGFQNYVYLWNVRKDNYGLLDENRKLLNVISEQKELLLENERFRKLLNFQEKHSIESIAARVIAKDVSTEFRAIRINRGENSGIKKDMAVVTNEGIVGRIFRTTLSTSDVLIILDPQSAVDAIDERSRTRGVVEGLTDEACVLRFILRTDDIQPGDVFISSGLGGIFPKGIPIGVASKVSKKSYGISQDVEIESSVDFSKLEEVLVVLRAETVLDKNKK